MSPESPAGRGPEGDPHGGELTLEAGPDGLELRLAGEHPGQGVRGTPMAGFELGEHERAGHPLARILRGVEGGVIDATAGLGVDGGVAAALGRNVLLIERDQVVHALLQDAIERARSGPGAEVAERMHLVQDDACRILADPPAGWERPGAVLLDPMFPPRRKRSALPPKPMQRLRTLLGHDDITGPTKLLNAARRSAARRVILKRPPDAEITFGEIGKPTFTIETKLLRWEVWERG